MIDRNRFGYLEQFDVSVGYHSVRVEGNSREEAISNARRALCADLPRLYDVISQMDDTRFAVEQVTQ